MSKIYIASKNMRGIRANPPNETPLYKLDVTSAQSKKSQSRLDFSPMTEIEDRYNGFYCFENFWQGGKIYEKFNSKTNNYEPVDHQQSQTYWKQLNQAKRKYPGNNRVISADYGFGNVDYISARKQVYVPKYYELIQDKISFWKDKIGMDKNTVVVYDFDGPRNEEGIPECQLVSLDLLKKKINEPQHPFGHGYIVAAALLCIHPSEYCS